jgi:hypothetical protein
MDDGVGGFPPNKYGPHPSWKGMTFSSSSPAANAHSSSHSRTKQSGVRRFLPYECGYLGGAASGALGLDEPHVQVKKDVSNNTAFYPQRVRLHRDGSAASARLVEQII